MQVQVTRSLNEHAMRLDDGTLHCGVYRLLQFHEINVLKWREGDVTLIERMSVLEGCAADASGFASAG